LDLSKFKEY